MRTTLSVWSVLAWGAGVVLAFVAATLTGSPAPAEASTLGWANPITTIFQEIRFIGFICVGGAATIAGIEILFHRSLDRLGNILSSLGVGTGLIVAGIGAAVVLTGAVATPLASVPYVVGRAEAWGDVFSQMVYYGTFVWTAASLWLEARRYGR